MTRQPGSCKGGKPWPLGHLKGWRVGIMLAEPGVSCNLGQKSDGALIYSRGVRGSQLLPKPRSNLCVCVCVWLSLRCVQPTRLPCSWDSSGKNTGMGSQPVPSPGDLVDPGITFGSPEIPMSHWGSPSENQRQALFPPSSDLFPTLPIGHNQLKAKMACLMLSIKVNFLWYRTGKRRIGNEIWKVKQVTQLFYILKINIKTTTGHINLISKCCINCFLQP